MPGARLLRSSLVLAATVAMLNGHVARAAELSVGDVVMLPGQTVDVVISGDITGESTIGVNILVELIPRTGALGTVSFTPTPPEDVVQRGDPWPDAGTFSAFDTDTTLSSMLNGSVDDNGTFLAEAVTFTGPLTACPVIASADADGVWDVVLSTSVGDSNWQDLATTLVAGTITVTPGECLGDADCNDGVVCTIDTCVDALCVNAPDDSVCPDDSVYCNGTEYCDTVVDCTSTGDPCTSGVFCNESGMSCDECVLNEHCDDGIGCTDDACVDASCVIVANDTNCTDDGLFCNGDEVCSVTLDCVSSGSPCASGELCDDSADVCNNCTLNTECEDGDPCTDNLCIGGLCETSNNSASCDDGQFCTETDTCLDGACVGSGDPCPGQVCDEPTDTCIGSSATLTVDALNLPNSTTDNLVVSGQIAGFDTFGVTLFVEIIPRAGNTGTVTFTPSPPMDVVQLDDPWPGVGTFTGFDSDATASPLLNGSVDDNGTFVAGSIVFTGPLVAFPVVASADAGGVWDVVLATSSGNSSWEGATTTLVAGTIIVDPPVGLSINSFALPPASISNLIVSGNVDGLDVFGVTVLVELVPQAGTTGTLTFTPAPPADIIALSDPWPGFGAFTAFDTDGTSSLMLNGSVDDNGSFIAASLSYSGSLVQFPVQASADANGVWTATLTTFNGASRWEVLSTVLLDGTITVAIDACLVDGDCEDGNACTDNVCIAGMCVESDNTIACDDGDQCTTNDTCALGMCVGSPVIEGGACDDGNLCSINDVCIGGVCAGSAVDCSSLDTSCAVGACDGATGSCVPVPINDGMGCDDGLLCTETDVCSGGFCGGVQIDCMALDTDCLVGTCNTSDGLCEALDVTNGSSCDDGDLCSENDVCTAGLCGGTAIDCSSLNDGCIVGSCNVSTGVCEAQAVSEGEACSDGNPCTVSDFCMSGVCAGSPKDCSGLDSFCSVGTCNAVTGVCERTALNEGQACDDGFSCTTGDACMGGFCAGTLVDAPSVDIALVPSVSTVQVGDVVEVDIVASSGTCADQPTASVEVIIVWNPALLSLVGRIDPVGSPWEESEFPDDAALDGLNAPFTGLPTSDGDAFYLAFAGFTLPKAVFIPATGTTVTTLQFQALDGSLGTSVDAPASEGLFTMTRVLASGPGAGSDITGSVTDAAITITECSVGMDCDDFNPCTDDVCTSGICSNPNNTLSCDDGIFCTATDTCTSGECVGVGDPCTSPQLCSESLDACVECLSAVDCIDGNVCTTDQCDGTGACQHPNNTATCDDGLFCTATDVCDAGSCGGSGDRCPGQLCNESTDACVECLGDGDCDDSNLCTTDVCNNGVCDHAANTLPCDDGLFCTQTDTCSGGVCVGVGDPCPGQLCRESDDTCVDCLTHSDCDDDNVCTNDFCNALGVCSNPNNTNTCNDGLFCTSTDVCVSGACVGSGEACPGMFCIEGRGLCLECLDSSHCNDNITCTSDFCAVSGVCIFDPVDAACDDGLYCNGSEICDAMAGCMTTQSPCDAPSLCDEATDDCGCDNPTAGSAGPHYIFATPAPGTRLVAIQVSGVDSEPDASCVSIYVQRDGSLGETPDFQFPAAWGTIFFSGSEILPGATYEVRSDCRDAPTDPRNLSGSVSATTWRWADVNDDGNVDFSDIADIVDGFTGVITGDELFRLDLAPCTRDRQIDFNDIAFAIDAFQNAPYPCAIPCP